jgi:hypothetical protein
VLAIVAMVLGNPDDLCGLAIQIALLADDSGSLTWPWCRRS